MLERLPRSQSVTARAQRIDQLMLPAVALLLLLGAGFIMTAWSNATDAVASAQHKDELRAERLARSVDRVLATRWLDLEAWSGRHANLLQPGREYELQRDLAHRVEDETSTAVAWMVVRDDGSVIAIGEQTPGRIAANQIADDLRQFGRLAARRSDVQVSGKLKLGNEALYAAGVALPRATPTAPRLSLVRVNYLDRSAIGAFIDDDDPDAVDAVSLVDRRGRVMLGASRMSSGDRIQRPVGHTGWSIEISRSKIDTFLPSWSYPLFALLLIVFAGTYVVQDLNRRRMRRIGDLRTRRAHALYELGSRVLHTDTIEDQVRDLARSALELADIDGAIVRIHALPNHIEAQAGTVRDGDEQLIVPISGPREPLGELVVTRDAMWLDEEEERVLQTAAAMVGAGMHTLLALETERAAAAELQRLDELRSNLLATVAHELLSPLTAVKGVLGLLAMQDDLGERGHEYVGVATERTDRLVELIRDLFDCSLLETGQLDIRPKRQLATELLDAALGAQVAARPGDLRLSATPNLMITVDPVRFDQLVNNLVTNAFRHGAPPVEVAVRPADRGVYVIVSDEGAGIPQADRTEIFGKFWQGSSGHARMKDGAGLGLSLVQGLVRIHGGDIEIDSTHADGRGARFTAFFPDEIPGHVAPMDGVAATPTPA